jgi:hypothetical protein
VNTLFAAHAGHGRAPGRDHDRRPGEPAGTAEHIADLSRRRFLAQGLGTLGALAAFSLAGRLRGAEPTPAPAAGGGPVKTGQFVFPRLRFDVTDNTPDRWNAGPIGDVNLRRQLAALTNINVSQEPRVVTLADFDDMVKNPFVFMTSEGHFNLTEVEQKNMREFLERGGFIHADDCVYQGQDRFFRQYNDWMARMFPDNPMRKIPHDHEIFHIYFDFPDGCPHMQGVNHGAYGLFEPGTGRIMTISTPGDLHCGWMCRFWAPEKNLAAIKMGINIIIYFLSH